ncbi:MAG: glutamine-synthetase adenylyltransferase, partial [Leisingera sp.]
ISQAGALTSGSVARDVAAGLRGAVAAGWLNDADAEYLQGSYRLFWSVQSAAQLLSGKAIEADRIGEGGAQFLCRTTGYARLDALEQELQARYARCAAIIAGALERDEADEGQH